MLEQGIPYRCPACDETLTIENIIRIDNYPFGGYRNMMKPCNTKASIFECPKCFELSCCHASYDSIETYKRFRELREEK